MSPSSARAPQASRRRSMPVSEGLSVIVFDASAFGGQAGASARIENHRFDAVLHFDETRAVKSLESTAEWETGELPETFPFAV